MYVLQNSLEDGSRICLSMNFAVISWQFFKKYCKIQRRELFTKGVNEIPLLSDTVPEEFLYSH